MGRADKISRTAALEGPEFSTPALGAGRGCRTYKHQDHHTTVMSPVCGSGNKVTMVNVKVNKVVSDCSVTEKTAGL